jgi:hypothetical protein
MTDGSQPWTPHGALEDDQLAPQREVLEHEGALGPDTTEEAREDQGHLPSSSIRPDDRSMLPRETR